MRNGKNAISSVPLWGMCLFPKLQRKIEEEKFKIKLQIGSIFIRYSLSFLSF